MTVNNSNPSVEYIGNAVLLEFAYNFRIDADTDLQVLVDEIDQVQYTDYTLINQTENGGDVLFAVAPADGAVILIVRFTSRTQQVDYEPFDAFPAETHEFALDKLTMIVQELDLEIKTGGEYDPIVLSVFGRIGNVEAQCSDYAHCYPSMADWSTHIGDANAHHPQLHTLSSHTDVDFDNNELKQGQGIWWDAIHSTWENRASATESWPTGLANGGELNIGPGVNDIEVITGLGLLVDSYTTPIAPPVLKGLSWAQINEPITAAPSVAGSVVWFSIAATATPAVPPDVGGIQIFVGELKQYATPPSPTLARQEIFLGVTVHNGITWNEISNPKVINQASETLREVATAVLPLSTIISGGEVTETGTFEVNQAAGVIWENNRNWHVSKSDPNREALPAQTPISFQYVTQDFSSVGAPVIVFDPDTYDVAGTPTPVGGTVNNTTIQKLYIDPANNYWVLYGQIIYPSFFTAVASLSADLAQSVIPFILQNSILLGSLVAERAKTQWDINEAIFIPATGGAGGSGGGGVPITVHNNLTSRDAADAHPITAITNFQNISSEVLNDGMYWNGATWELGRRTKAIGNFVQGNTYFKGDEVFDGSDVSECRLDGTTSEPFVSPVGTPEYVYKGTGMANTPTLASQVIFGNRYTNATQPMYITGYRLNVVAGNKYVVNLVIDPLGTPIIETLTSFIAGSSGWIELAVNAVAVEAGFTIDLICTVSLPAPVPIVVTALYDYQTPQNAIDPLPGEIQHGRSQQDQMRISYTDDVGGDRTGLISGLSIGDTITDGVINWAVQSNSPQGTWGLIGVAPASVSVANIKNFDFETVAPSSLSVPSDPAYWPTSPTPSVLGLLGVDVPYGGVLTDTNAYGTDLLVQPAYIPDQTEWFLKIIAG